MFREIFGPPSGDAKPINVGEWWPPIAALAIVVLLGLNLWATMHAASEARMREAAAYAAAPAPATASPQPATTADVEAIAAKLDEIKGVLCATASDRSGLAYISVCPFGGFAQPPR